MWCEGCHVAPETERPRLSAPWCRACRAGCGTCTSWRCRAHRCRSGWGQGAAVLHLLAAHVLHLRVARPPPAADGSGVSSSPSPPCSSPAGLLRPGRRPALILWPALPPQPRRHRAQRPHRRRPGAGRAGGPGPCGAGRCLPPQARAVALRSGRMCCAVACCAADAVSCKRLPGTRRGVTLRRFGAPLAAAQRAFMSRPQTFLTTTPTIPGTLGTPGAPPPPSSLDMQPHDSQSTSRGSQQRFNQKGKQVRGQSGSAGVPGAAQGAASSQRTARPPPPRPAAGLLHRLPRCEV